MKRALVHDWYYINGGAEKVVHSFNSIWDDFDHFALIDFLNDTDRSYILNGKSVTTSFIQHLPRASKNHRMYVQLFPYAVEQLNLSEYDLILSSSASIAKGVLSNQNQLHICYCHSPMRYAWDLYFQYLNDAKLSSRLKATYAKYVLHKLRMWDVVSSNRVDEFVANSKFISRRIKKVYNRDSTVIYPPVDVENIAFQDTKDDFYFTASRMVSYKRIDLIVKAFNGMPEKKLYVSGDGPEYDKIKKIANANIEFLGFLGKEDLQNYMKNAKAFVFAAEEDFGIIPVEAQASGTPVIAYNKGGLRETVIADKTGVFFDFQTEEAIQHAVKEFEKKEFDAYQIREHVYQFSKERFQIEMEEFVNMKYEEFKFK